MSAFVPSGSLVFTGFGDAATRFTSPTGDEREGPAGLWPGQPGTYFQGVVQLPSGLYGCCVDGGSPAFETFQVYTKDWAYVGGWGSFPGPGGYATRGMCGVGSSGWYVLTSGTGGNLFIRQFGLSGNLVASWQITGFTFSGFPSIAVNAAGTIAYWGKQNPSTGTGLKRWDLSGGSALSDLVAMEGDGPCNLNGIIVLADDTIVVGWHTGSLKRYDASGTLLNTYTLPTVGSNAFYVLARGADASSFWVSTYEDSGGMGIYQIRTADGARLQYFAKDLSGFEWDGPFGVVLVGLGLAPVPLHTPPAPQIQCAPQTTVGNGGTGAAGCNTGGVGVVRAYAGPWGDVPDHDDPEDGETFTGKDEESVEVWVEINHIDDPSGDVQPILRAMVPLADPPDYHGGYKPEGLQAVGDVEHALGNERGGFEAATVDIRIFDEENAA